MFGFRFKNTASDIANPGLTPSYNQGPEAPELLPMALECHGLVKSFGEVQAVREFNLSVPFG